MLLKNLINNLSKEKKKINITGLAINSKNVVKGNIFFALKGNKLNGEQFIKEAIKKGASVIVSSRNFKSIKRNVIFIKNKNIRNLISSISAKYYKLKPKNIIAVTGTNGKTSVADFFYQILSLNKIPVASIGTLGVKYKNKHFKTGLTSPDTISLHKHLQMLKENNINNVIIEASSHGLDQMRLHNIKFKSAIFTNFSQDHLDYHKSMKKYLDAKLILFNKIMQKNKYVISDRSIKVFDNLKKIAKSRELKIIEINKITKIVRNILPDKSEFNVKNLSMAVEASRRCGLNYKKIFKSLKRIKDVNGRLELVRTFPNNVKVYIDYAHTPDALLKVLKTLSGKYEKNISLVFGCGGERDKYKRSIMGRIANNYCNKIYVTDDNPRNENPSKIRNQIIKEIKKDKYFNIGNRLKAIKKSIINSEPNEVILIAGKGHEDQQIYKKKIINISDKRVVKNLKLKIKKISEKKQNYLQNQLIFKKIKKNAKTQDFAGISIDSRTIKKDNVFLTVKGSNNDGVKFIPDALKKGAKFVITSKSSKKYKNKIIKVKNEILFLKKFAKLKRDYSSAKIIAITGSAGKTSLKNLLGGLLDNFKKTYSSPKSFNNHLGVPISLSNLSTEDKFGVFEVGMSKPGEIENLTRTIRPHIGVITNIGEAHIENFKNILGIAEAKGELINNIKKNGTIILNRDDNFFKYLSKKANSKNIKVVTFGKNIKSDIRLTKIVNKKNIKKIDVMVKGEKISLYINNLNIYNVLASLAVLKELRLNLKLTHSIFKDFKPSVGRGRIYPISRYGKKFKIIDESYNANPLSVKNAINNFNSIKKHKFKKYLLLGDMLELGLKSEDYHKKLSKVINKSDIDKVFIKGEKTLFTYKNLNKNKQGNILQNNDDIDFVLNDLITNNDYLMIKGSNATGLNILSSKLIKGLNVI